MATPTGVWELASLLSDSKQKRPGYPGRFFLVSVYTDAHARLIVR